LALYIDAGLCLIYSANMDRPSDLSESVPDAKTTAVPSPAENTSKAAPDYENIKPEDDVPDPDEDDLDDLDGIIPQ
jgi:hypothetical protein